MNSQLLAFRVAKKLEDGKSDPIPFLYDPSTQRAVWTGDGRARSAGTCSYNLYNGWSGCYGYAYYCNTSGSYHINYGGYVCD